MLEAVVKVHHVVSYSVQWFSLGMLIYWSISAFEASWRWYWLDGLQCLACNVKVKGSSHLGSALIFQHSCMP